ncbi:cilia- and flagella-associated protein 74 [Garra rufa]|uniref:cilia- and flagella-associated protein 74 n=1 Tax=Garra rufa TaxID=137080 RepID=UPI003CCE7704
MEASATITEDTPDSFSDMVNVLRQSLPAAPTTISNTPLSRPMNYSGDPGGCNGFLLQCSLYIEANAHQFPNESSKIYFMISLLTGQALQWADALWNSRSDALISYNAFVAHFKDVFGAALTPLSVHDELITLNQGTSNIHDYTLRFRSLAATSGWNQVALLAAYRKGLKPQIRKHMVIYDDDVPLETFIKKAVGISQHLSACPSTKSVPSFPPLRTSSPQRDAEEPMITDSYRLDPAERKRRINNRLCLYCGEASHFISACPVRPPRPMVSTVSITPAMSLLPHITAELIVNSRTLPIYVLVDSGAAGNFVSSHFIAKHRIPTVQNEVTYQITTIQNSPLGDGKISRRTRKVTLVSQHNHREHLTLLVLPRANVDVILGRPWLIKHQPRIDWSTGEVLEWGATCEDHGYHPSSSDTESPYRPIPLHATTIESPATQSATAIPPVYQSFTDVFSKERATQLPPHRPWDCSIDLLPGAKLPHGKIYPLSRPEQEAMENYIQEALQQGFIRPSTSPAASSFFFVPKKDGGLRPCIDYRVLNDATVKFAYPLPLVPAALEELREARVFTKLDLRSAYNLIRIREGDEWKTAFITPTGHYEYQVMPYGLANSPSVFQNFMNEIFRDYLHRFVIIYIDDILIYSRNLKEHQDHVRQVLQRLREYQLYLKLEKCEFHQPTISFLGYVITAEGVHMEAGKVDAVAKWAEPRTVKELQRFLGFANFYRRFIKNYSLLSAPLTSLLKGGRRVLQWTPEAQQAFDRLKLMFTTAPILKHPDPSRPFVVEVDAADVGVGAVLSQWSDEPRSLHPCAYYSKKLTPAEQNYGIGDRELLAIKLALEEWRHWLEGAQFPFTVITDHKNLQYIQNAKRLNARQARWSLFFARFNFHITYQPGHKNTKADALSRMHSPEPTSDDPDPILPPSVFLAPILWEELKAFQLHVTNLEELRDKIEVDIEKEKQAENSVALFRLRAQHKGVCTELQVEEDLGAHLAMILKEHELELCQVEVELGRFSSLRQELELEEKNVRSQDKKKQKLRLQREKNVIKERRHKAKHDKIESDKALQEEVDVHRKQQEQALASHRKAAVYLKQTLQRMKQKKAEAEERKKALIKKRQAAVMALKASFAATQETMCARKQRQKAYEQKQKEQEQQMRESLEAKGLNSTELIHRLRQQEQFNRKIVEFEDTQRVGQMEIVAKLFLEQNTKEKYRKSPVLGHEKKHDEKLAQNLLPPSAHTRREERHVVSSSRASYVRSHSVGDSDVSSSLDSAELKWGEHVEMEDEDEEEMNLAQPEFTGLWEHKHKDYTITSDENIQLESSYNNIKMDTNKSLVSKVAKNTVKSRESKGPPFISKPEIVLFKDCDVGKIYKKKVTLTNVTYMTNYCKLLGVSQNLKDYVSVSFEPPGPMPAGMTCELEVIFRPLLDMDLGGVIQFQSATGPFSVSVKCAKKKCEMVVDQCLVDFGTHVVGQKVSRIITLTNRGAVGTRYMLTPITTGPLQQTFANTPVSGETASAEVPSVNAENTAEIPSESPVSSHSPDEVLMADPGSVDTTVEQSSFEPTEFSIGEAYGGDVGPFMSVKLPIIFTPTIPGEAKLDFQITFSQPSCEPIVVSVCGVAESAPVWVTEPNIDLKICMYDRLYQDSIKVQSRASTTLRLTFKVCKEMRNHMSILPKTGFIQAKSSFSAQMKFLPRQSLYADAKNFFNKDTGVLEVPLTVQVADQACPFMVHAVITSSDLQFNHTEVDFGHCSIYESAQITVRLTNSSLLPQEFGFVGNPKFIDIQPNDGFGTLLPLQCMDIYLIFSPSKAGEYNFTLTCKTSINRDFLLSCHATAIQPSLKLSDCLVEFGRTAVGDRTTAVLYVENQQPQPPPHFSAGPEAAAQLFTFSVPENSDINITPTSGRVLPGQKCLVQVTFSPTLSDDAISAETLRWREEFHTDTSSYRYPEADTKSKMGTPLLLVKDHGSKVMSANGSPIHSPSPADIQAGSFEYLAVKASLLRSFTERHIRYVISCFTSSSDIVLDTSEEPRYSPHETLYLELCCPAIRPALLLISDNGRNTIHFNQVAVGQKVVKKVIIQNISSETVKLTSSLLDVTGPFSVLNAMRSIGPEDTHTLLIAFTPSLAKKYYETLEVSCSQMSLELALCGEAVNPIITCSNEGHIKFDYVPVNESASHVLRLQNMSSLDVQFGVLLESHCPTEGNDLILAAMDSAVHVGTQNYSGMSVFRVSPSGGAITSNGAVDITVTFHPDHGSLHYRDVLRVQLINKQTVCMLKLRGSSCRHNMFVCGGDPVDVCSESLIPSHIYTSGLIKHEESKSLLLTLRSEYQEGKAIVATRRLHIGCVYSTKPTTKKTVEFNWENISPVEQQGFKVTPMQGSVDAGHRCPITITWMPPSGLTPNAVVQARALLTVRGDEIDVYRVTLMAHTDKNTAT